MAVSKPLLTEFGIHHRLESCVPVLLELIFSSEASRRHTGTGGEDGSFSSTASSWEISSRPLPK